MQRAIDAYCADRRRGGRHGDVILIDGRHGDIARSQQRLAIDMPGAEALPRAMQCCDRRPKSEQLELSHIANISPGFLADSKTMTTLANIRLDQCKY
jgi:hypothetical protein